MPTYQKFEDMEVWQKSRELVRKIYQASSQSSFAKDFGLRDQIRRAGVSIISNIAEGFERSGTGEFTQFLSLAKGSAGEVRAQLYVALDLGYITQGVFNDLRMQATEIGRMLGGFMGYLRGTSIKGTKFK